MYNDAVIQAANGKGEIRHGHGKGFYDQQWAEIAKHHGIGFLTGQSCKKINEAAVMKDKDGYTMQQWENEMLGAINYLAMAVLYRRYLEGDNLVGTFERVHPKHAPENLRGKATTNGVWPDGAPG